MTVAKDDKDRLEEFYTRLERDINWRNKFIALLNPDYVRRDAKDVEIDLYNANPLVIGEVTAVTRSIDKVTLFLRKVAFLEKKLGPAKYKLFITYNFDPSIREEALRLLSDGILTSFWSHATD